MAQKSKKLAKYYLNAQGEFIIENYNFSKPFANFFPGIAGRYGIPMWVFYVNRGQAIVSFGTKDKDHAILEFFPANKAWQLVSLRGFRTFIKLYTGKKFLFYEPFQNGFANMAYDLGNRMSITSSDLRIAEDNLSMGLATEVEYFTIPQDSYAALVRVMTLKNKTSSSKRLQVLDGLPQVVPFGVSNLFLKKLSRTIEAWMDVENLRKGAAFFKLDVDPTDRPQVIHINAGNFYLGIDFGNRKPQIIKPIVDPQVIFGSVTDFACPQEFISQKKFAYPKKQMSECKTPCAFALLDIELKPKEEKTFYTLVGNMRSQEMLNAALKRIASREYLTEKRIENKRVIGRLVSDIKTESGSQEFDLYAQQTYLDNVMRGGYPEIFKNNGRQVVYYLYSRKHGDLERDYNKFQIDPTYLSQGNGNYRDINQNRRCDIWFHPETKEDNILTFFNLTQADGFNPLVVKGAKFTAKDSQELNQILKGTVGNKHISLVASFLNKPFTPGDLIFFLENQKIRLKNISYDDFLNLLLPCCTKTVEAEHGEGFWIDHWTYNLDLLETYLGVYPEKLKEIVFEKRAFTFFDNTEVVRPRSEKYILKDGVIRQFHAVGACNAKKELIRSRTQNPHILRMQYGKGEIYKTTLANKLFCLLANKLASLDPFGMGVEMEADKPNWFDSLNGLPGLFGSSLCETWELKRLALFIGQCLEKTGVEEISLGEEIHDFLVRLDKLIKVHLDSDAGDKDLLFWDKSYTFKEEYREKTKLGFSGREKKISASIVKAILNQAIKKIEIGISKAQDKKNGVYYAYFINEVKDYLKLKPPFIRPTQFVQKKLPLFLEGQVHALRTTAGQKKAKLLYAGVKKSRLYDKKLRMYKVCESLKSMPEEIGRCRVFTPGWLEHESIWLHMEYKYLLEILKCGLYEEFYADFKNALIPFQKPQRYGRSILENSSFLVSSAFPDSRLHGNGFVARLSGSTAEFLHIWLVMNLGKEPFFLNKRKELNLRLQPVLAGWLFDRKGLYGFNLLSTTWVKYHNPQRKSTFGKNSVAVTKIVFQDKDKKTVEIPGDTIPSPYACQIREGLIKRLEAYLE